MKPIKIRTAAMATLACVASLLALIAAAATWDDGKLDTGYFGKDLPFHEAEEIDYIWVKEGFSVKGHTLHFVEWPEHDFLGEKASERDENDHRLARQMNGDMHQLFSDSWGRNLNGAETSLKSGDIKVEGRIVDCSTGSTAAKVLVGFGAGAGKTTIDLKFTNAKTGELLAALHHQVVSGTSWSTTDSKFVKWTQKFAKEANKEGGLYGLYDSGKKVKE